MGEQDVRDRGATVELLISAAVSVSESLDEIVGIYSRVHPEVRIICNYGSSGGLARQIEQGAPVDIFLSAGQEQMRGLQDLGLVDDSAVRFLLKNHLVLIYPGNGDPLSSFDDLLESRVERIGIGAPESVPAGMYAAQVFDSLNLTENIGPKLVLARDVREAEAFVDYLFPEEAGRVFTDYGFNLAE